MAGEVYRPGGLNREELIAGINVLLHGGFASEAEDDALMARIEASFFHPGVSELIFYPKRPMTAEEVVEEALAYKPIAL